MEERSLRLICRGWPARNAPWSSKPTTAKLRRACIFSCAPSRKFPRQDEALESAITISVNGEAHDAHPGASVADLLRELGLDSGRVAIERNLEILPRPQWAHTLVERGDRYEIVQFVGGG
jgi:sulfur carrier protein